jgi:RND family efflux transporter MFP subunit
MLADQVDVVEPKPLETQKPEKGPLRSRPRRRRWGRGVLVVFILVAAGIGGIYAVNSEKGRSQKPEEERVAAGSEEAGGSRPTVEVVQPQRGGMERTTNQPGSIRAFDFAPLYAKVSGYLDKLNVDRGSRVQEGELLLEIYDPELDAAVAQAKAELEHAHAAVAQAEQKVKVAEAFARAAEARQNKAVADLESATATRIYRNQALQRITELAQRQSIEPRLVDEETEHYHASVAAEHSAQAGIETAKAEYHEAQARIEQAKADLVAARADVDVSQAKLKVAQVFLDYTKLKSPYTGVVIQRGEAVHPGAFVQAATQGLGEALLTVARDDVMRTIIQVPDTDVPYCDRGDPVIVRLDALRGREFKGVVSRIAESEDPQDRTMRAEVDLPNPDHILRDGMWGRGEILLEKGTKNLVLPSSCLTERNGQGDGTVLVVVDGKVHRRRVHVGRDDGVQIEILSGLDPNAQVVIQPDTSMSEGTSVRVESATESPAGQAPEAAPAAKGATGLSGHA